MNLFTADVGQNSVHVYDSTNDKFYGKLPQNKLIELDIEGIKRGDILVIEDAHLRERVEGGKSVAHAFGFNSLKRLYDNAQLKGITIKLFPHKKTPVTRRLAGYDPELIKKNKKFMEKYNISTDEADVRSIAQFLKRDAAAFRCLKNFIPIREEQYHKENEHVFDYISEANIDINTARTQGYGFDEYYDYDDAPSQFIKNQKYELCKRLTQDDGIFDSGDNEFEGEELMAALGLKYAAKGKGKLNKISSESRLYTLVSSFLRPNGELRERGFPPGHKYYGQKMFPNWKFVKANYLGLKPFHMKAGVAASNYKQHMRPGVSNFKGKTLAVSMEDKDYFYFKDERRRVDKMIYKIWKVLRKMIYEDGLR